MKRVSAPLLTVAATLLCATTIRAQQLGSAITESSRPVRLLHDWHDTIKTPRGGAPPGVDRLFDSWKGRAFGRCCEIAGRLFFERRCVVNPPLPSEKEIE